MSKKIKQIKLGATVRLRVHSGEIHSRGRSCIIGAVFEDSIARCLAVAVRDDHAKIML